MFRAGHRASPVSLDGCLLVQSCSSVAVAVGRSGTQRAGHHWEVDLRLSLLGVLAVALAGEAHASLLTSAFGPARRAASTHLTLPFDFVMFITYIANMTFWDVPATLRTIRANLDLTQAELAERLGVSFATVNRWEGGGNKPQKAPMARILDVAAEAGIDVGDIPASAAPAPTRRRGRAAATQGTKPMEQMLWDAACSIRGEKDAPKFKDYLLPLLFLKRLSDVFDDEIDRLAEEYGDRETALEIAEADHCAAALLPAARGALGA